MKNIINISIWTIVIAGLFTLLGFISKKQKEVVCRGVEIKINHSDDNLFIEEKDIMKRINNFEGGILNKPLSMLNIKEIENLLNHHPSIASTEVYTSVDGIVKVDITERKPIIRIFENNGASYYLDTEGNVMPLTFKYTSRVVVANGNINIENGVRNDLFVLAQYINKNKFWKAQITQVYINNKKEIELIPRVGNHRIIFGNINDMDRKFKKLMLFYKKGLSRVGWNKYSSVNLKFKNQIICTKKQ